MYERSIQAPIRLPVARGLLQDWDTLVEARTEGELQHPNGRRAARLVGAVGVTAFRSAVCAGAGS